MTISVERDQGRKRVLKSGGGHIKKGGTSKQVHSPRGFGGMLTRKILNIETAALPLIAYFRLKFSILHTMV